MSLRERGKICSYLERYLKLGLMREGEKTVRENLSDSIVFPGALKNSHFHEIDESRAIFMGLLLSLSSFPYLLLNRGMHQCLQEIEDFF